jgi:NADPH-dependent 2,4-dienoyl-CoA reductase/sulfur reductase-like enzyme
MRLRINGQPVEAVAGVSVAAAVAAGGAAARISLRGEQRGPLCGMGICYECRVTIDGVAHLRGCQIPAAEGMEIATGAPAQAAAGAVPPPAPSRSAEIVVVGGGPAGMAAAARAAEAGRAVILVDDNPALGGQIWRATANPWAERVARAQVSVLPRTRIVASPAPGRLWAESPAGSLELECGQLILATGARERFLPFPGWTLPHVLGAGGLQAMAKSGLPVAGKRIVVAGAGPLLLAVGAYLRQHGAEIVAVCDQAGWAAMAEFGAGLPWSKLAEGAKLARILRGVPLWRGAWPVEARLGEVVIARAGGKRQVTVACDYLACGFHLVPNAELAALLGCAAQNGCVIVNARQETTVAGIFCAGEPTGVGGVDLAVAEGEIAGLAAAGVAAPPELLAARDRYRGFAERLARACELRPELRALPRPDTLVCRCEDVPHAQLQAHHDGRSAKLLTRCGMGPCQARVCGPACEFLYGWRPDAVRPPLFTARLATLAR